MGCHMTGGCAWFVTDDEVDKLMNSVALPLEITVQKGQKTWNELQDGIDKIQKAEKSKITLTLSQVSELIDGSIAHNQLLQNSAKPVWSTEEFCDTVNERLQKDCCQYAHGN